MSDSSETDAADPLPSDSDSLLNVAVRVAVTVGRAVTAGRRTGTGRVSTKSSPTDMVTEWDAHGENIVASLLAQIRPNDGVYGEEGTRSSGTSGITWFVDPIDGTTNFLYGIPIHAVSIAACDSVGPVAAAVYVPVHRELFVARRDHGAWLRGRRLSCTDGTDVDTALIATGFSYLADRRRLQIERLVDVMPRIRDIRRIGSAAVDLCYVAAGRLDGYFEEYLQPWDYMAGMLIATEAGARCTRPDGRPVDSGEILASGPDRHAQLLELLATSA
ncbi:MAG: inositol monophosphatase family protein [Ilumatobacteraceae bacterium]